MNNICCTCNAGMPYIYVDSVTGQMLCATQGTSNCEILAIIFWPLSPHLIGIMFEVNLHCVFVGLFEVCFIVCLK